MQGYPKMFHLVYVSSAVKLFSRPELIELLARARAKKDKKSNGTIKSR